ncbi:NAD(P)H-dependent flavin oxidoreductase [Micromonospora lutea]|uniref:2-nitropropane dioxygenase n=1 Tax=Micromonospora lutea TaxID=419825 RepID=A0ABQ4J2A7_9ACTN|nr:nitronate monooxygenase [Micromonospora lutea]GIJ24280.1 2-nitropropane dioxygenase [Micromonospora lutea]
MVDVPATAGVLGVRLPLVQAGMGGVTGPALAAAVAEAGALGTVALYRFDPMTAAELVRRTAVNTSATFGVNVIPEVAGATLPAQIASVLDAADRRLVINVYGLPPAWLIPRVHDAGHTVLVQVGSASDAERAAADGADVLALQGVEAGGHHLGDQPVAELLAEVLDRGVPVPVLAAGGIQRADQVAEHLRAGASGCLCGTAFVVAAEATAHPDYQAAIVEADDDATTVTDRFAIGWPGRRHRVLRSGVTQAAEPPAGRFVAWTTVTGRRLPVPCGSAAVPTVETQGRIAEMARYAGTGSRWVTAVQPAAEIVSRLTGLADTSPPIARIGSTP